MKNTYLEFEKPIEELEQKIDQLRHMSGDSAVDISEEIAKLQQKSNDLTESIYKKFDQLAKKKSINKSLFIENAMIEYIKKEDKEYVINR